LGETNRSAYSTTNQQYNHGDKILSSPAPHPDGPRPVRCGSRILEAISRPTIGHLDPVFVAMMDEMKALLQYAFQTKNPLTLPVSAPGSAGMEMCFVDLVESGDKVIVCPNGVFGGRMKKTWSAAARRPSWWKIPGARRWTLANWKMR
jgi:aspartate aminotransferase-like enzyme